MIHGLIVLILLQPVSAPATAPASPSDILLPAFGFGARTLPVGEKVMEVGLLTSRMAVGLGNGTEWGFQNYMVPGILLGGLGIYAMTRPEEEDDQEGNNALGVIAITLLSLAAFVPQPYYKAVLDDDGSSSLALVAHLGLPGGVYFVKSLYGDPVKWHFSGGWGTSFYARTGPFLSVDMLARLATGLLFTLKVRGDVGTASFSSDSSDYAVQGTALAGLRYAGRDFYIDFVGGLLYGSTLRYLVGAEDKSDPDSDKYQWLPYLQIAFSWAL